ncbi:MAG: DNA mismatch repair protein MutS [Eubacteriales bacterium]|nr:DNA mismatch repair protein MutS [Eubacteriales bacterium]
MDKAKLTPMMQQYFELKQEYQDCILFFRLGDFYEMFFEDAKVASRELEIALTGRDCGMEEKAPMCGVPHHAVDNYLYRLVNKGYKVAICEQVEDPATAKGIVKRDVVRIVTPGTNLNPENLDESKNNYIFCLATYGGGYGVAYTDISTGDFRTTGVHSLDRAMAEVAKVMPAEILLAEDLAKDQELTKVIADQYRIFISTKEDWYFEESHCREILQNHFGMMSLEGLGNLESSHLIASGALLHYVTDTQKGNVAQIQHVEVYHPEQYMILDSATRRNLELTETMRDKEKKGSLLWVLDKTRTAMGARMLRFFLQQPLLEEKRIEERLTAVEELKNSPFLLADIRELLEPIYDLERLMTKLIAKTANPRDLIAFKNSLAMLPHIHQVLQEASAGLTLQIKNKMDLLEDIRQKIEDGICDEPPISSKEGGVIKSGYHEQVDAFRFASTEGKTWLLELEQKEKEATGIKNLKIKYNRVFGYYLEVTNSYAHLVPEHYMRKQTTANAERYITAELKKMEETILGAEEKLLALEYELFQEIREYCAGQAERIKQTAIQIACLDVLQSFAYVAGKQNYVRPVFSQDGSTKIEEGRHPVIEKILAENEFIVNSTELTAKEHCLIITGPNMAGKSTYMRQIALIQLMAQIGSFVPATSAVLSKVDRIFTRVGASDDLASGKSTFMVEMAETANILRNATKDSLIILDEIGRGTSTYDGLSIAWAVVEYLANRQLSGAKTLFATHYHELTELEGKIDGVVNYCISVAERGENIIFLRKIIRGGADKSYGIQVARLAGIPNMVVKRAREILAELSEADIAAQKKIQPKNLAFTSPDSVQLNLFAEDSYLDEIKTMDLDDMTPKQAWEYLSRLQKKIKR